MVHKYPPPRPPPSIQSSSVLPQNRVHRLWAVQWCNSFVTIGQLKVEIGEILPRGKLGGDIACIEYTTTRHRKSHE